MRVFGTLLAAILALSLARSAQAQTCQLDADCPVGSRCLKSGGELNGVCASGNEPDRRPSDDPRDPNRSVGQTCVVDADCAPGISCVRSERSIHGTCMR
jgi:hypothetical protein